MGRAWIIGNGPSLTPQTLSLLKDEITFACGRINKMYYKTSWRPSHYVMAEARGRIDEYEMRKDLKEIANKNTTCHIQWGLKGIFNKNLQSKCNGYELFYTCKHGITNNPPDSWHLPQLCHYGGSLFVAMQIATREGYSPLYLIGCDLVGGHFDGYGNMRDDAELWLNAHKIANNSRDEIYNATIGGNLEVYPRVDIMEVI